MLYQQAKYLTSAVKISQLPKDEGAEVAFMGRSNSGKSSALNTITGIKGLARTSSTPGRTQMINLFGLDDSHTLVDLPGYGYAAAPKTDIKAWSGLTRKFLVGRPSLQRVFLLIDSRRGVGRSDEDIMQVLDDAAVSWAVVLTKSDKLKPFQIDKTVENTYAKIRRHVAAFPEIFITSSETKNGIEYLRAHMAGFALPKFNHSSYT